MILILCLLLSIQVYKYEEALRNDTMLLDYFHIEKAKPQEGKKIANATYNLHPEQ